MFRKESYVNGRVERTALELLHKHFISEVEFVKKLNADLKSFRNKEIDFKARPNLTIKL